jgi:hypothetical protein
MVEMLTPQDVSRITGLSLETLAQWRSKTIHLPDLKTMRHRPIRPNVYLPVVKFGVVSSDWKFVLGAIFIGYTAPFLLDLKLWRVKLGLWTGVSAAAFAVAFFNWARIGQRPHWLQHKIRALVESPRQRRALGHNIARDMEQWLTLRY